MKKLYTIILTLTLCGLNEFAFSQGCIAVRHMACATGNVNNPSSMMHKGQFQLTVGYRKLHSYKHFVGTEEQTARTDAGTQVINDSHNLDFGLSYSVNSQLSFSLNMPYSDNDRSSLYEHYGNAIETNPTQARFHTYSKGVGDARLSVTYWLLDPMTHPKGSIAIGAGIKAPTGDYNAKSNFYRLDKLGKEYIQYKAVDQSMQLGDGGWGYSVEVQGYKSLFKNASAYFNGFYLFSPKELNPETNFSVPDQFGARAGVSYSLIPKRGLAITLGGRIEGLPAIDLIGSSIGSRRPGYIISVEPGITWSDVHHTLALNVPYALVRNRTKSWSDRQDPAGLKHGDAAFADYLISATYAFRF